MSIFTNSATPRRPNAIRQTYVASINRQYTYRR